MGFQKSKFEKLRTTLKGANSIKDFEVGESFLRCMVKGGDQSVNMEVSRAGCSWPPSVHVYDVMDRKSRVSTPPTLINP